MTDRHNLEKLIHKLTGDAVLLDEHLDLALGGFTIRIRSNHKPLLQKLAAYFSHVLPGNSEPDIEVVAVERDVISDSSFKFTDWAREPGKTGRKDAYFDVPGARLVHKVRTGMLFLQSSTTRIAAGPCLQNDNQLINFINSQYMDWLQHNGWLICHASGMEVNGHAVGMAGLSGGGKSTLMLNLMEDDSVNYITNDRLFIRANDNAVIARGIPKLPRINPGTIVHNKRLHSLISQQRRDELLQLPKQELWHLEEKYDVHIEQVYGANRVTTEAALDAFVILNWQHNTAGKTAVTAVDINQRRELLAAVMKSPGPFYQHTDGNFHSDAAEFDEQSYLDALRGVTIYEVTGKVDFDIAGQRLAEILELK